MILVGSPNSSNSNRLREVAAKLGKPSYLVDNASELRQKWFDAVGTVGITAGASAPAILIEEVARQLEAWGGRRVVGAQGKSESVVFSLPKSLLRATSKSSVI